MLLLYLPTNLKINLFKNSFRNTIIVSNSLDPDQNWHYVSHDLHPNCLQRLSADDNSHSWQDKPLSHQSCILTAVPRRPRKMQIAEVHTVRSQASLQQRSSIASGYSGIALKADFEQTQNKQLHSKVSYNAVRPPRAPTKVVVQTPWSSVAFAGRFNCRDIPMPIWG